MKYINLHQMAHYVREKTFKMSREESRKWWRREEGRVGARRAEEKRTCHTHTHTQDIWYVAQLDL